MQRKPHLRALTGLRFIAAAWVMSLHLWQIETESRGVQYLGAGGVVRAIEHAISAGSAGVTLFFVLSGFILTYTYWDPDERTSFDRRAFWWARFSRIYPVYALGLLVGLGPWLVTLELHRYSPLVTAEKIGGVFGATVLLLQSWIPRMAHRWNGVGWSLSNEAFFYVAFAFIILPLSRVGRRTLLATAVVAYTVSMAVAVAAVRSTPELLPYVYYHPLVRMTDFVIGMVAGLAFVRARAVGDAPGWAGAVAAAALAVSMAILVRADRVPAVLVQNALLSPLFAAAIYALAWGKGLVARVLAARPLVLLGEASYALYVLHLLLLRFVFGLAGPSVYARTWWFALAVSGAIVALSVAVFRYYEEPARRRLRARLTARQERAVAAAVPEAATLAPLALPPDSMPFTSPSA